MRPLPRPADRTVADVSLPAASPRPPHLASSLELNRRSTPRSTPKRRGGKRALILEDDFGERSPSPDFPGEEHDVFVDAFDTIDDDEGLRTPRASTNSGMALSPVFEAMENSPFHDLSPQEQVSRVESEGGIPFELCRQSWTQEVHSRRIAELLNATKERVAREKNVDRAATYAARRRMSIDAEDPPEMSLYDQAKGVVGRMQLGRTSPSLSSPRRSSRRSARSRPRRTC